MSQSVCPFLSRTFPTTTPENGSGWYLARVACLGEECPAYWENGFRAVCLRIGLGATV